MPDMPPCTSTEQEDMQLRKNATTRNRPAAIRRPFLCLRAKSAWHLLGQRFKLYAFEVEPELGSRSLLTNHRDLRPAHNAVFFFLIPLYGRHPAIPHYPCNFSKYRLRAEPRASASDRANNSPNSVSAPDNPFK